MFQPLKVVARNDITLTRTALVRTGGRHWSMGIDPTGLKELTMTAIPCLSRTSLPP